MWFNKSHTSSYSSSTETVPVCYTVSRIQWVIGWKLQLLMSPCSLRILEHSLLLSKLAWWVAT